jgi:hypothetical protein
MNERIPHAQVQTGTRTAGQTYTVSKHVSAWQWALGALVVIGIGVYLARNATHEVTTAPSVTPAPASAPMAIATPHYPVPAAPPESTPEAGAPPPALDTSDTGVANALSALPGASGLGNLLAPAQLIAHIVAVIDALPRHELANNLLPLRTPKGTLITADVNGAKVISDANYARYAPYMQIIEDIDARASVDWYVRYYPLFQDAYRQLGYPKGYFNDRLVTVIDNLLATPEPIGPVALTQPKVLYEYANPALQSLSAGQKMLLRAGPANAAAIKSKLRAIRADLIARAPTPSGVTPPAAGASQ